MDRGKNQDMSLLWEDKIKEQFNKRCDEFNVSASWITDPQLLSAHVDLAGTPGGEVLDLCCGTGMVGSAFKSAGWKVTGLDITENMIRCASESFPVFHGSADSIPFDSHRFDLVVCRQAFQFLKTQKVLSEISRVLKPGGILILSQTVPFSEVDRPWLEKIHKVKQALLLRFLTLDILLEELREAGFAVEDTKKLEARESITLWMAHAPELSQEIRREVCFLVRNAPPEYYNLHKVEEVEGEIFEDWHWVLIRSRSDSYTNPGGRSVNGK